MGVKSSLASEDAAHGFIGAVSYLLQEPSVDVCCLQMLFYSFSWRLLQLHRILMDQGDRKSVV